IRDFHVTGVQTCALPISLAISAAEAEALCAEIAAEMAEEGLQPQALSPGRWYMAWPVPPRVRFFPLPAVIGADLYPHMPVGEDRSEERRVGNEWGSRGDR